MSMHAHTQACVRSQLYVCTYFEPVYTCRKHAHVDTTLRNRNAKNRAKNKTKQNKTKKKKKEKNKTKTNETNNLTCFKIGKLCKLKLNKHIIIKMNKRNKEMKIKIDKRKEKETWNITTKQKLQGLILTIPLSQIYSQINK